MMEQSNSDAVNPQETLTVEDLAWLGGFLDADGSIFLSRRSRKGGTYHYTPYMVFCNTNEWVVEELSRVLKLARIGHWIQWRNKAYKGHNKKPWSRLEIHGLKRCAHALKVLIPYIRGKKAQAKTLQEFVQRRLDIGPSSKRSYNGIDDEFYSKMKGLNKGSSETTRGELVSKRVKI